MLYKQKSLKVQLPKGELLDGHRVFTLNNDPSPMVVGEQIILDLLEQRGVLVPRSDFARVAINDTDLGVFRYETQPEESLLRAHRREPGSMYSGDLPGSAPAGELWTGISRWRKVAWREEEEKEDYGELERLLAHVREASDRRVRRLRAPRDRPRRRSRSSRRSTSRSAASSTTSARTTSSTSTPTAGAGSRSPGASAASSTIRTSIASRTRCCCGSSSCPATSRCATGCSIGS